MKSMVRLLLVGLPVVAICTFLFVQKQLGGIAPAPPATSSSDEEEVTATPLTPRTAQLQPTVLAPQLNTDGTTLPPGIESSEIGPTIVLQSDGDSGNNEVIPIPDLQQPTTLLEFPE